MIGNGVVDFLFVFFMTPICWSFLSILSLKIIIKFYEPAKVVLCLKIYCVFLMSLVIEALIRSIIYYERVVNGRLDEYLTLYLTISILVLCFCVLTLWRKFTKLVTSSIYIFFVSILAFQIFTFPFVSLIFETSLKILFAWGCIASALCGISLYTGVEKKETISAKERIYRVTLSLYAILIVIIILLVFYHGINHRDLDHQKLRDYFDNALIFHRKSHPDVNFKFPHEEAFDVTDYIDNEEYHKNTHTIPPLKIIKSGIVTLVVKNKRYSLQYNVEGWFYYNRGLSSSGYGSYSDMSLREYKIMLTESKNNYNTADMNTPYDGVGNVFYRGLYVYK